MTTKVSVDADKLRQILEAITGPGHLIRELQAIRSIGSDPISALVDEYNLQVFGPIETKAAGVEFAEAKHVAFMKAIPEMLEEDLVLQLIVHQTLTAALLDALVKRRERAPIVKPPLRIV